MPTDKLDAFRIPPEHDKRRKIPQSEHANIKQMRAEGWSMRKIAARYEVDKRLIHFILFPERLAASRKNRDWREYYDKDKRRTDMQKHRAHKREIIKKLGITL